jgi:hypothetical protein
MGMGDLDDAIREHLELKRRHGASEEELVTKEREAQRQGALPSDPGAPPPLEAPDEPVESAPEPPPRLPDDLEPDEVLPEEALEIGIPPAEQPGDAGAPAPDWSPADLPEDPGDDGEDVLEETPEFLEDIPEQDSLWFEQRPPKDFDFDD